jgi:hypothetical protein
MDLHDMRMLKTRLGFGLDAEPRQGFRPGMVAGQDHLEGDDAVEADLAGLVHNAHAAPAQLAEDLIARHGRQLRRRRALPAAAFRSTLRGGRPHC